MDWKTFISTLAKDFAWPAVVVFLSISFRSELRKLVARISKVKSNLLDVDVELNELKEGVEKSIGESIQHVPALLDEAARTATHAQDENVSKVTSEELKVAPATGDEIKLLVRMAEQKPRASCRSAWSLLHRSIGRLSGTYGIDLFAADLPIGLEALNASPVLVDTARRLEKIIDELSESEISTESAKEFVLLCGALIVDIEKLVRDRAARIGRKP